MRLRLQVVLLAIVMLGAQAPVTHYVTPAGSATSGCTQAAPCSLARAVQLVGTPSLPVNSTVSLAPGVYSQGQLTFRGNGVRFVGQDGVRIVGTRTKPEGWVKTTGQQYTYEVPFTSYPVTTVAQRPPTIWRPIKVDDISSTGQSLGRAFDLIFPIRYTLRASVAEVEAQSCTFWHDVPHGRLYVHLCHDGAPTGADNLYVGSQGWGQIVVQGDDLTLENLTLEQVGGTALKVDTDADRLTLRRITASAAQVWLEGKGTVVEDLDVSHVIAQGTLPNSDCHDANPDFGKGECWQGSGRGDALLVGRQGSTLFLNQTITRAFVHRSWNGVRVDGYNTLQASRVWGIANHGLQVSGPGPTVAHTVISQAQDSLYMEGLAWNNLTFLHDTFVNGALVWASRDGRPVGPAPVTWSFRYNVLAAIVLDDRSLPAAQMDCNVYIPSQPNPSHLLKVTSTMGKPSVTYKTLAQVQAGLALERNSLEKPSFWWRAGPLFLPDTYADPLRVCGERAGI